MLNIIPAHIVVIFIAIVLLTLILFLRAVPNKTIVLVICLVWLAVQGRIAYNGFYQNEKSIPPHFLLAAGPPLIAIILLFITKGGRRFIDGIDLRAIVLLSIVRIFVE